MKTKSILARFLTTPVRLAALAVAATGLACSLGFLPTYSGTLVFGTTSRDLAAMGDTRVYLDGAFSQDAVVQWYNYDAACNPISYRFWGTTDEGYRFSGIGDPSGGGKKRRTTSNTLNLNVTSITVSDSAGAVLATDDGGFKLSFVYSGALGAN